MVHFSGERGRCRRVKVRLFGLALISKSATMFASYIVFHRSEVVSQQPISVDFDKIRVDRVITHIHLCLHWWGSFSVKQTLMFRNSNNICMAVRSRMFIGFIANKAHTIIVKGLYKLRNREVGGILLK